MRVPQKNWVEWAVFGSSLALTLAVGASLLYSHFNGVRLPASIRIVAGDPIRTAMGFAVPLEIYNDGDVTAESVKIEAVLALPGADERSDAEVSFVPYRSRRGAWVNFIGDPRRGTLSIRVVSYQDP